MSEIESILRESRTIAVVGLSSNPFRPSFDISEYLQRNGYRIVPVNPNEASVLGEASVADLKMAGAGIDLVLVFRRPEFAEPIAKEAIEIGARAIWLQPGAEHAGAVELARNAGLLAVSGPCIMIEHRALSRAGADRSE